jgi:hypothetical protein
MFELLAGQYIASQLRQFGIEPAGEKDSSGNQTYIQTVYITRNSFAETPKLSYTANDAATTLEHGKEMLVARLNAASVSGNLQKMTLAEKPKTGAVAFVRFNAKDDPAKAMQQAQSILDAGAAVIIIEETPVLRAQWERIAARKISYTNIGGSSAKTAPPSATIVVSAAAANALAQIADGTPIEIKGTLAPVETRQLTTRSAN